MARLLGHCEQHLDGLLVTSLAKSINIFKHTRLMTKTTLVDQYRKYLATLKKEDTDVVQCYSKLTDLFNRYNGSELSSLTTVLEVDAIHHTLVQVERRDIKLYRLSEYGEWSRTAVAECYDVIHQLCKAEKEYMDGLHDQTNYSRAFMRYWKLTSAQPVHVRLYMYLVLRGQWKKWKKDEKAEFFGTERERVKRLMQAKTDEEIDRILTVQPSEEELTREAEAPATSQKTLNTQNWWKLWEEFTNDAYTLVTSIRQNAEGKSDEELQTAADQLVCVLQEKWKDVHTYKDEGWNPAEAFSRFAEGEVGILQLLKLKETPQDEAEKAIESLTSEYC